MTASESAGRRSDRTRFQHAKGKQYKPYKPFGSERWSLTVERCRVLRARADQLAAEALAQAEESK